MCDVYYSHRAIIFDNLPEILASYLNWELIAVSLVRSSIYVERCRGTSSTRELFLKSIIEMRAI